MQTYILQVHPFESFTLPASIFCHSQFVCATFGLLHLVALFARPPFPFSSLDFLLPALEGPGDEGPHPPGERGGPPRV